MLNSELISVTINQLDNMKHAIGYKRDSVKRGKYRSYRNYYASGATDESWEHLINQGYATGGNGYYHVSEKGFELIENILDIKIVDI